MHYVGYAEVTKLANNFQILTIAGLGIIDDPKEPHSPQADPIFLSFWCFNFCPVKMAAAVSNAGGLGIITALTIAQGDDGADKLRAEIKKCRALTAKPFGVNITLLPVGVPPDFEGIVRVIIEEGVKVVETAGRSPDEIIRPLKAAGVVVIHKCVAIRHALSAARAGADMISMDGFDCGETLHLTRNP